MYSIQNMIKKDKINTSLKQSVSFLLLSCCFLCCHYYKPKEEQANIPIVKLAATDAEVVPVDQIVDSVDIDLLSLPDSVQFGSITTLKEYNQYLILSSEYNSNSLVVFRNEVFLYHLQQIGSGPGEYISLFGFYADTTKSELVVYDRRTQKITNYDLPTGKFKSEKRIDLFLSNLEAVGANDVIYSIDYSGKTGSFEYIYLTDSNFEKATPVLEANNQLTADATFPFNFTVVNGRMLYMQPISETLWEFENGKMTPRFQLDFGNRSIPSQLLREVEIHEMETRLASGDYSFSSHLPNLKGSQFSCFFYTSTDTYQLEIVDIDKMTGRQFKNVTENINEDGVLWPKACFDGLYVTPIRADEMESTEKSFWYHQITSAHPDIGTNDIVLIRYSLTRNF